MDMPLKIFQKTFSTDTYLKFAAVFALLLLAVSAFIYAVKGSRTKTNYQFCYDNCLTLGLPANNGSCDNSHYLGVRKTDHGQYKKGDSWCYNNAGICLAICKDK